MPSGVSEQQHINSISVVDSALTVKWTCPRCEHRNTNTVDIGPACTITCANTAVCGVDNSELSYDGDYYGEPLKPRFGGIMYYPERDLPLGKP
jgi:transcription elongation factor Elf1